MTWQIMFWMLLISILLSIGLLWWGSRIALGRYRSDKKEGKDPDPFFSLNFTLCAAFIIFFAGFMAPLIFMPGTNEFLAKDGKNGALYASLGFIGMLLAFFFVFVTTCEWLLRKMVRLSEPKIQFDRWLFLK